MSFWLVVIAVLVGVPAVLMMTGMGAIFAAGGLVGGPQASRVKTILYGWLAFAWALASVFGAFGLAPVWRAWHGGDQNFDGGLQAFVHWLGGVGVVILLGAAFARAVSSKQPGR